MATRLKTPISYYGGKQRMLQHILPILPAHTSYVEPFCGGAAVFFAKPGSTVEVLNDTNGELINFYHVLQTRLPELRELVRTTLCSRKLHRQAQTIYRAPAGHDAVTRAWALWVLATQSFSCKLDGPWGFDKQRTTQSGKILRAKARFDPETYAQRLNNTQLECDDAPEVIRRHDHTGAFHYVDPPYCGSNCGHYGGYTWEQYRALLERLEKVEGKFLLSSYPSELLAEFVARNGWHQIQVKKAVAVSQHTVKTKIEVLTANYPI